APDEPLVDDVQHLEEGHVGRDLLGRVVDQPPRRVRPRLAPDLQMNRDACGHIESATLSRPSASGLRPWAAGLRPALGSGPSALGLRPGLWALGLGPWALGLGPWALGVAASRQLPA